MVQSWGKLAIVEKGFGSSGDGEKTSVGPWTLRRHLIEIDRCFLFC